MAEKIQVTPHAVDRASFRAFGTWRMYRLKDEGLYSWLMRIAIEAMQDGIKDGKGRYIHKYTGLHLAINHGQRPPALVTIITRDRR